jgi:hypothetical protein
MVCMYMVCGGGVVGGGGDRSLFRLHTLAQGLEFRIYVLGFRV